MTEVETAREIAAWCERHKDADLPAWVVIVCLFDHGSAETELDWESLVAAANRFTPSPRWSRLLWAALAIDVLVAAVMLWLVVPRA
jgi:hypothetical protein